MQNLPSWLQTLLASSLVVAAYRSLAFVWPWVFKGGKWIFGKLTEPKESPVTINIGMPPTSTPQLPGPGPVMPVPSETAPWAGAQGQLPQLETPPHHPSFPTMSALSPLVTQEDLRREIDAAISALPDGIVSGPDLANQLSGYARADDLKRVEAKMDAETTHAQTFREETLQKVAILLDRSTRPRGTR